MEKQTADKALAGVGNGIWSGVKLGWRGAKATAAAGGAAINAAQDKRVDAVTPCTHPPTTTVAAACLFSASWSWCCGGHRAPSNPPAPSTLVPF